MTGIIVAGNARSWIKKNLGWGRGLRKDRKRCDLCPEHLKMEQKLFEEEKAAKEARKRERDEKRKAKSAAKPSPSAACAPAPA